jgi:hypothetical protein
MQGKGEFESNTLGLRDPSWWICGRDGIDLVDMHDRRHLALTRWSCTTDGIDST